jgi:twitching motility protein PilT
MEVKDLLKIVIAKNASDLHLSVGLPPMMRWNGMLSKLLDHLLTPEDIEVMVKAVLPEGVALVPDTDMDLAVELKGVARFRLNIYYDRNGICAAFRFVPAVIKPLGDLGVPDVVAQVSGMRRGLVLVTGVTGSGKSTTLASIIDLINARRQDHIITVEDPIEFVYTHKQCVINQRQIGIHTRSFADALRSALREDPDVILLGELRDLETISMARTAVETGHLVLSTLHTRGAAQTVDRIIDIFPPHQQEQVRVQLAETLEMVVSQVLLPSVDGRSRYLASEIMVMTNAVRQHIRQRQTHLITTEIETGSPFGMQTMEKSLKYLINTGKISKETALPWVNDKRALD